jgi:histidyl-tRNA synthetase
MSDLSTKSYKGVRDFYPEDKRRQNYLFSVMRETAERFGYQEVDGSVLEPADLYDAKSGSELAQEQSYRFMDRGDREVMLRPEMTPTTVRMLAGKYKSMSFPVRWFSIPNLFRYEQPQRGRLREHWQFNADIFGVHSQLAEVEIIQIAHQLLIDFGATPDDFEVRINSRNVVDALLNEAITCDSKTEKKLYGVLDKREKITKAEFEDDLSNLLSEEDQIAVSNFVKASSPTEFAKDYGPELNNAATKLESLLNRLKKLGVKNVRFDPSIVRGLDYYTGTVFEIFDTDETNNRAVCGGGCYTDMMEMFGAEKVPAVGFGLGDVPLADFLDVHNLWPKFDTLVDVVVVLVDRKKHADYGYRVAQKLRKFGKRVSVDISGSNVGTQFKQAANAGAKEVIVIGDEELENNTVTVKTLETSEETTLNFANLVSFWE